jgi:hypothetical protein
MLSLTHSGLLTAQKTETKQILIDVGHGQRFWNDPADMKDQPLSQTARVQYMTDEITKTAASVNGKIGYIKGTIKPDDLAKCDLLFIHLPAVQYKPDEVRNIKRYVEKGGALFLVMDVDYWSTLEQTNVNDLVTPYGIQFEGDSRDTLSGGYTKPSAITDKELKVTYHGARILKGGTPFCFNNQSDEVFGVYTDVKNGGKIVAMGDGMVSLYMTSWKGIDDYPCGEFMQEVFSWLVTDAKKSKPNTAVQK